MKSLKHLNITVLLVSVMLFTQFSAFSQDALKRIGIVYIDTKGIDTNYQVTPLVRLELSKLNIYDVINQYDMNEVLKANNIIEKECLSKDKIIAAGKLLKSDFMLGGSVERYDNRILIMFREINTGSGETVRSITKDFPQVDHDLQILIEVTLKGMYGIKLNDPNKENLDKKNAIANAVSNPEENMISIGGPRFGFGFLTGTAGEFMQRPKNQGGRDGYPALFQFGYQFEKMYLNEGNLQALVEFIPTLSGMDQGLMIPSFTLLNGFRSAHTGWEFAFGPTITWASVAKGYMQNDKWHLEREWTSLQANPYTIEERYDTRGDLRSKPGLLLAAGKTFKSGKLNMPLNFYIVPRVKTMQIGVSYGINTMKSSK